MFFALGPENPLNSLNNDFLQKVSLLRFSGTYQMSDTSEDIVALQKLDPRKVFFEQLIYQ